MSYVTRIRAINPSLLQSAYDVLIDFGPVATVSVIGRGTAFRPYVEIHIRPIM